MNLERTRDDPCAIVADGSSLVTHGQNILPYIVCHCVMYDDDYDLLTGLLYAD